MILILSDYIYKHSHITHILEKSCFNMPVSLLSRIFLSFQLHIVVTCLLAVLPFMSFQIHVIATCSPPVLSVDIKVLLFSSAFYRVSIFNLGLAMKLKIFPIDSATTPPTYDAIDIVPSHIHSEAIGAVVKGCTLLIKGDDKT
uniref:Uncharacterized protein n=1 Tax=Solanum lycopersicum TaxID=4081 RepID=A0A3Q7IV08_SOLLC